MKNPELFMIGVLNAFKTNSVTKTTVSDKGSFQKTQYPWKVKQKKFKTHLGRQQMNFCHIILWVFSPQIQCEEINLSPLYLSAYTLKVIRKTRDGMQEQKEEYKL